MSAGKLATVAERIQAHLEQLAREWRKQPYRDARDRRCRAREIFRPIVSVGENGGYLVVRYAPFRDLGHRLSPSFARGYLAWLDAGGMGQHWHFSKAIPTTFYRPVAAFSEGDGASPKTPALSPHD